MTRKTLKKRRIKVTLPGGMAIYSEEGVTPWSEFLEEWKSAATTPLPEGSGAPTVLAWIDNMGDIGRKKGRSSKGDEDNFPPKITTIPEYLTLADAIGKEKNLSDEQFSAVTKLKKYLEDNDNATSEINPQNISFNAIDDYEENEDGEGVATDWKQVFGDYRVPKYRRFRNRYKNGDVPAIPTDWYSFEGKGKANPPVYQALWGTKGTDWFGSKSLLELCTEFEEQELEELPFKPERESPLKVGGNGTAEFLMNNVPGFRKFVLDTVNDTDQYQLPNGKYRPKRAMNMQRKNPTPYPLTDAQSDAFMEFLDAKYNYDLSGLFLDVNWRQMEHAAKMLPEYKAKGYGKKVEKSNVSKDRVKKSQEKSPVSLSWKEIMKVRT